jgi:hypothetical protein
MCGLLLLFRFSLFPPNTVSFSPRTLTQITEASAFINLNFVQNVLARFRLSGVFLDQSLLVYVSNSAFLQIGSYYLAVFSGFLFTPLQSDYYLRPISMMCPAQVHYFAPGVGDVISNDDKTNYFAQVSNALAVAIGGVNPPAVLGQIDDNFPSQGMGIFTYKLSASGAAVSTPLAPNYALSSAVVISIFLSTILAIATTYVLVKGIGGRISLEWVQRANMVKQYEQIQRQLKTDKLVNYAELQSSKEKLEIASDVVVTVPSIFQFPTLMVIYPSLLFCVGRTLFSA